MPSRLVGYSESNHGFFAPYQWCADSEANLPVRRCRERSRAEQSPPLSNATYLPGVHWEQLRHSYFKTCTGDDDSITDSNSVLFDPNIQMEISSRPSSVLSTPCHTTTSCCCFPLSVLINATARTHSKSGVSLARGVRSGAALLTRLPFQLDAKQQPRTAVSKCSAEEERI